MSRGSLRKRPVRAFILLTTKPGASQEVVRSRRIKGVKMANSVFGRYDAVVVVEADDLKQLSRVIYDMIEQQPNVVHTETLVAIFHPPTLEPP